MKARKHKRIMMLAEAKINAIRDHISKLLYVNHVSDEEVAFIPSELGKSNQVKDEIRTQTKTITDDESKQSLIKQGKQQALEKFKSMIGKTP